MELDKKLIQQASKGDIGAFGTLYHRHRDWVYRLAWRFTRNHELSLDVVQETFAHLLKKLPDFILTVKLTTYLYPVVKHIAFEMKRKNTRVIFDDNALTEQAFMPAPTETTDDLAKVLSVLPVAQREVLLMRFVDGMSLREIAGALSVPQGTVKSRLHNALETLRENPKTRQYFLNQ